MVDYSKQGDIAVMTVNNPPVNPLSHGVREGLCEGLATAAADDSVKALVIIGGGRTFIAGADISEFGTPKTTAEPTLVKLFDDLANFPKPSVSAIHGTAFGGGLEIALACHFRIAVPTAQVGLPEVKLGLLPAAGGTQRLPRLIGIQKTLDMIISGDPADAAEAKLLGILDEVVDGDLLTAAVSFAEQVVAEARPMRRVDQMEDGLAEAKVDPEIFDRARAQADKAQRGFAAPQAIIDAVEFAVHNPIEDGLVHEQRAIAKLFKQQSPAMVHVFFGERAVAKIPDVPKDTPVKNVAQAAVIGAGTMGGGIAMNFANAGIPVTIIDMAQDGLDRGLETIAKNYANTVKKGRLSQADMDKRLGLISGSVSYDDAADADFVVEAVFEEMELKKEVFGKLDGICKADAILASNTSTLDIDAMANATDRPGQVIGTHFFSPANVMRLLEVVRGGNSAPETIATAMALGRQLGKISVLAGNCHGFIGNRMLHGYTRQAAFLLEEGALPQQVDKVIFDFGMPMGPFTMGDMAGLDVGWRIRKAQASTRPNHIRYSPLADKICELGRYGQKTSNGYYHYEPGDRTPIPDPEIEELIIRNSEELGIERRDLSDDEILKRCIYPLINEGAKILEEGIALRPVDIDIVYVYGYGFPQYRGGPMNYADQIGLDKVYADICRFAEADPVNWKPAPLLEKLAKEGKKFADL